MRQIGDLCFPMDVPSVGRNRNHKRAIQKAKYLFQGNTTLNYHHKKSRSTDLWVATDTRDIFIRGARGALPPLNFDNPKRSKIVYVTCGTIIRRVVAAARCKSSVIYFWIF